MKQIESLMKKEWNVFIECKGSHRGIPMSYEAHATKSGEYGIRQLHAVGDTLEEVGNALVSQLKETEEPSSI